MNSGFRGRRGLTYYEKVQSVTAEGSAVLASLGATVPPAGLWERLAGMAEAKQLVERRLVLPLANPEAADEHGVEPPQAVVLFGPPGTGKSTFAQAVASRLGWPFVELFPSRIALEDGLANGLGRRFEEIAQLDHVLVFIDEVEEVAGTRNLADPVSVGVVNELLKSIVRFRDRDGRLLVCATNTVAALDPAFLRHGRFDYVPPVGPPDHEARTALWASYLARTGAEADTALLADASGVHPRRHQAGRPDRRPGRLRAHPRHRNPRAPHHRGLPAHHQPHLSHRHHRDGAGVRRSHHPVREDLRAQERAAERGPALNSSRTPLPYSSRITGS